MKTILVTGASGQLGQSIMALAGEHRCFNFIFKTSKELDITKKDDLEVVFSNQKFDWCINCAAYTSVDKAEEEKEYADLVNYNGVKSLANQCKKAATKLIHISTDFVFDGESKTPYKETDQAKPINVYGASKLKGEDIIKDILKEYYILRTSWLYSVYGSNFMKTIIQASKNKKELNVVVDQFGTPTHTKDLAEVIFKLISFEGEHQYGIYHYSNEGSISWFDFTKEIFRLREIKTDIKPIPSVSFKALAKRPKYSVLDKEKIKGYLQITIPEWRISLENCLKDYVVKN